MGRFKTDMYPLRFFNALTFWTFGVYTLAGVALTSVFHEVLATKPISSISKYSGSRLETFMEKRQLRSQAVIPFPELEGSWRRYYIPT